jgi:WhiB family redox-sensing transcriptional regulator
MKRATESDKSWRDLAACSGMDPALFYPERGEEVATAKAVCAVCPVQAECLAAGLYEKFGIWGGTSERERRKLRHTAATRLSIAS